MNKKAVLVDPADIKIGNLVAAHGFVMRAEHISIWCHTAEQYAQHKDAACESVEVHDWSAFHDPDNLRLGEDLACFGIRGSFVSGDREMFDYFRRTISEGPNCGKREELSYQQGNRRAGWQVVPQEEFSA